VHTVFGEETCNKETWM